MNFHKKSDFNKEAEQLRAKGLKDEKVIRELIAFRNNHPELNKEKMPTGMYDKVNLMCRKYMDRLARFELDYDFIVDEEAFRTVGICCLETVYCLRSKVINNPIAPYWKKADYHISDFITVKEVADIDKAREEFYSLSIPLDSNIQMKIALFYYENRTYICFIWNHMCMDGGGFKMFWADFCRNYSLYVTEGVAPFNFATGSRMHTDVYKDMDKETAKRAKKQFANISPENRHRFPFENDNVEGKVIISSRRVSAEDFFRAVAFSKSVNATVTDLLLASYIDALAKIADISENEPVSIACATDLRRYIKDFSTVGYTNHVSFIHCSLDKKGSSLEETLKNVSLVTKELKKDEFMGLHGLPLLNIAYKSMVYLQAETIVKLFYNNPVFSVSNVGAIDTKAYSLNKNEPFSAFVAGAAKHKPCAVMTALTINGELSASICLRGTDRDKIVLEKFFDEFEKNIKSFS